MPDDPRFGDDCHREVAARRRELQIAELAEQQYGVVSRGQLLAMGFSAAAIRTRLVRGRLRIVHRSVYAAGHRLLTAKGQWMAAVLAGGHRAALSHRPGGGHWGLGTGMAGPVDVTCPVRRTSRAGLRFHQAVLPADELTIHEAIPITTVARTLLDLAGVLDREHLEQAIAKAEMLGLGDSPSLPELIERYQRFRGRKQLRAILEDGLGGGVARSELEVRFRRLLRQRGLPLPEMNVWLELAGEWRQVDCVWRDASLIAELDGRAHHADWASSEADRARDRALVAAGWRCVRVTWNQLHHEPERVAAHLRSALARRVVGSR